jgi:hypothetical protein
MKFSKYISKAVTSVMALFQKQHRRPSNKATTICGHPAERLRQMPVRHNRRGFCTEIKVRYVPPTMCRLTLKLYVYDEQEETLQKVKDTRRRTAFWRWGYNSVERKRVLYVFLL